MAMALRAGRFLTEADLPKDDMLVVVANQTAVNRYWPDRDPIGAYGRLNQAAGTRFQVVGVVGDVRNDGLNAAPEAELYLLADIIPLNPVSFVVRSSAAAGAAAHGAPPRDRTGRSHARDARSEDDERDRRRVAAAGKDDVGNDDVLRDRGAGDGHAGHLRRRLLRRSPAHRGDGHAHGAGRRGTRSAPAGRRRRIEAGWMQASRLARSPLARGVWVLVRQLEVRDVSWLSVVFSTAIVGGVAVVASWIPAWRTTGLSPMVAIRDQQASMWQSAQRGLQRAVHSVAGTMSNRIEGPTSIPTTALTEFVAASRSAGSYADALQTVLVRVCGTLGVESAVLLESSGGGYQGTVAVGDVRAALTGHRRGRLSRRPRGRFLAAAAVRKR